MGNKPISFFLKHTSSNDLAFVRSAILSEKAKGKPYTVLIEETANMLDSERREWESEINLLVKNYAQARAKTGASINPKARELERKLNEAIENFGSFEAEKIRLAASNGLRIKCAESYTINELEQLNRIQSIYYRARNLGDFDSAVKMFASYIKLRNENLNRNIQRAIEEEALQTRSPVKAIVIVGQAHGGVSGRGGLFGLFDREYFARTSSRTQSVRQAFLEEGVTKEELEFNELLLSYALPLAEKSAEELGKFRLPVSVSQRLLELRKAFAPTK